MHAVLRKFSKRRPRTYGLILLVLGAVLAQFGEWGAASSIPIFEMILGIAFGIVMILGIAFLVLGSKFNPDEPSSEEIKPRALGTLNIASFGLLIGAMGQFWFYGRLFPRLLVLGVLFLPWLTVYTISFCNQPLFGPRPYRRCLLVVMGWYAFVSVLAEVIQVFAHLPADGHFTLTAARVLMYFGALSFIVFIRACTALRRYETKQDA